MSEKKKPRRLSAAQVAEKCKRDEAILALLLRDVSERRIALQLSVSRNTVRRVRERYINARVAELESSGARIRALHVGRYAVLHERAHQFMTANPSDARGLQAARDVLDSMGRLLGLDQPPAPPVVTVNTAPATSLDLSALSDEQFEALDAVIRAITGREPEPNTSFGQPRRSVEVSKEGINVVELGADGTRRVVDQRRAGFSPSAIPEWAPEPEPRRPEAPCAARQSPSEPLGGPEAAQALPEPANAPSEPASAAPEPGQDRLAQGESRQATAEPNVVKCGEFARFFSAGR